MTRSRSEELGKATYQCCTVSRAPKPALVPKYGAARRVSLMVILMLALYLIAAGFSSSAFAVNLPQGFSDKPVLRINQPTALANTPNGRILVTNKFGKLVVMKDGRILRNPALNVSGIICSNRERGLLGVAVDPNFRSNNYIYLY